MSQDAVPDQEGAVVPSQVAGPTLVLTVQELTSLEEAHVHGLEDPSDPSDPARSVRVAAGDTGALAQARSSLVARGLLRQDGRLPEDTDLGLLLRTLLDVRLAAEALVVVERLVGQGRRDLRLLHLVPQGGVVEDVHPEGLHGLDLALPGRALITAVTEMVVPADARAGSGEEVILDPGDLAHLPDALRRPSVLAELTWLPAGGEEAGHLAALGPRGCWAGPRPHGPEPCRLRPVDPGWVAQLVAPWVDVQAPGWPGPGMVHEEGHDHEGGTMAR